MGPLWQRILFVWLLSLAPLSESFQGDLVCQLRWPYERSLARMGRGERRIVRVKMADAGGGLEADKLLNRVKQLEAKCSRLEIELRRAREHKALISAKAARAKVQYASGGVDDKEKLLLGCLVAGAFMGLLSGRLLGFGVPGMICGTFAAVYNQDREGKLGKFTRVSGKLVVIGAYKVRAWWQEAGTRWKAWRVYERLFKEFENFDEKYDVTSHVSSWDQKFGISKTTVGLWTKVADGALAAEQAVIKEVMPSLEGAGGKINEAIEPYWQAISGEHVANITSSYTNLTNSWWKSATEGWDWGKTSISAGSSDDVEGKSGTVSDISAESVNGKGAIQDPVEPEEAAERNREMAFSASERKEEEGRGGLAATQKGSQ
ncbi:unnamed protein product, partial [Chrysoparadoxa australica]